MTPAHVEFLALYDAFAQRLHTYCLRLLGSADDAADVLQETFTNVLVQLERERSILHPRAYLYATARNACLRRIDERRRVEATDELPEDPPEGELPPAEVVALTHDLQIEVRAAHDRLPDRQREVLVLREVEGMSYAEIGELMTLTPNGAAQLAWRARSGMRGAMRLGALHSIAADGEDCERALTLVELREDGELSPEDEQWLTDHLDGCRRCGVNLGAMADAGATYRAALPLAPLPFFADEAFAMASAEMAAHSAIGAGGVADRAARFARGSRAPAGTLVAVLAALFVGAAWEGDISPDDPPPAVIAGLSPDTREPSAALRALRFAEEEQRERSTASADDDDADGASAADDGGGAGSDDGGDEDQGSFETSTPELGNVEAEDDGLVREQEASRRPDEGAPTAGEPVADSTGPAAPVIVLSGPPVTEPTREDPPGGPGGEDPGAPPEPPACEPGDFDEDSSGRGRGRGRGGSDESGRGRGRGRGGDEEKPAPCPGDGPHMALDNSGPGNAEDRMSDEQDAGGHSDGEQNDEGPSRGRPLALSVSLDR